MQKKALMLVGIFLLVPAVATASVTINEIAWMGSAEDANNEWIELYNDGSAEDVTGWTLATTDGQPTITLEGTIAGGAYVLLERSDDEGVPGVSAFLIYTGALGNSGEVLELRDGTGALVDRVDGRDDWAIGGDNTEKLTLQRAASGGTWITAEQTPGAVNAISDVVSESEADQSNETGSEQTSQSSSKKAKVVPLNERTTSSSKARSVSTPSAPPSLSMSIGDDVTIPAGIPLVYVANLWNENGKQLNLDTVSWNFGDGATGKGVRTKHTYLYEGDYVVTASASRGTFSRPITAEDRVVVHVIPLELAITHVDLFSLEVQNDSRHEINLSGFTLAAGGTYFHIPDGTVLLAGAHVRFPTKVTKLTLHDPRTVGIYTPDGKLVARYTEAVADGHVEFAPELEDDEVAADDTDTENMESSNDEPPEEIAPAVHGEARVAPISVEKALSYLPTIAKPYTKSAAVAYAFGNDPSHEEEEETSLRWWLLALVGTILTAAVAIVLVRKEQKEVIEGYTIENDE